MAEYCEQECVREGSKYQKAAGPFRHPSAEIRRTKRLDWDSDDEEEYEEEEENLAKKNIW